ncbi:MAG: DMT family transporter [Rhodospirillaceae bacterium]
MTPSTSGKGGYAGAAALMITSVTLFTVSHGMVRIVSEGVHPLAIAFTTSLFSFTFYSPWLVRTRLRELRTSRIKIHWVRAFCNASAVWGWYLALTLVPLADAVAVSLAGPLVITLGAVLFLGEVARMRRWVAMGIGIVGALLIIRPGFEAFNFGYLFIFMNLTMTAGSRLITKHLTKTEASVALGAWIALLQIPITFVVAVFFWSWPTLEQWAMMIGIGLLVGGAHFTLTIAYNRADLGSLEPFNFVRLVLAALIGFFFFAEEPGLLTWIGAAVIVTATSYIAHREAVRQREEKR